MEWVKCVCQTNNGLSKYFYNDAIIASPLHKLEFFFFFCFFRIIMKTKKTKNKRPCLNICMYLNNLLCMSRLDWVWFSSSHWIGFWTFFYLLFPFDFQLNRWLLTKHLILHIQHLLVLSTSYASLMLMHVWIASQVWV